MSIEFQNIRAAELARRARINMIIANRKLKGSIGQASVIVAEALDFMALPDTPTIPGTIAQSSFGDEFPTMNWDAVKQFNATFPWETCSNFLHEALQVYFAFLVSRVILTWVGGKLNKSSVVQLLVALTDPYMKIFKPVKLNGLDISAVCSLLVLSNIISVSAGL
eukprot:CAMPEP_0196658014 /NCGR_PEP_ID=MMETSP1086-20130531/26668_1 /TAXON_ID=77921 /ORGANISM="Cyanoptyche  gloeocystis , Strain SAG4.97" /LENGTH=164 /DNA_ID=CAMNT_0041991375 /DNA_START=387 /DNA_END=881 /DNA_ORIENTATION=+